MRNSLECYSSKEKLLQYQIGLIQIQSNKLLMKKRVSLKRKSDEHIVHSKMPKVAKMSTDLKKKTLKGKELGLKTNNGANVRKRRSDSGVPRKKGRRPKKQNSQDDDDECADSKCLHPNGSEVDWVQCDGGCDKWFHMLCVGIDKNSINTDEDYYCKICKLNSPVPDNTNQNNDEPDNTNNTAKIPSLSTTTDKSSKTDELPKENTNESKEQICSKIHSRSVKDQENCTELTENTVETHSEIEKSSSTEEKTLISENTSQKNETNSSIGIENATEKENHSSTISSKDEQSDVAKASKEIEKKSNSLDKCNEVSMMEVDDNLRSQSKIATDCTLPAELGNKVEFSVNITSTINGNVNGSGIIETEKQAVF